MLNPLKICLVLIFLLTLASPVHADTIHLSVNGSDGTGGFEAGTLSNWSVYKRYISGVDPKEFENGFISGTAYQGTYSYGMNPTLAKKTGGAGISFVYEIGRSFGNFYYPINEIATWNFTAALYYSTSIGSGGTYGSVSMCVNFNVTNASLESDAVIFHYCQYLLTNSELANSSTDKFYHHSSSAATPGVWYLLNRTNLSEDFSSYMGLKWNVSNITFTQIINATSVGKTNNITYFHISDVMNISGTILPAPPVINWVNTTNGLMPIYNNSVGVLCTANVTDINKDYKYVNFTVIAPNSTVLLNEVNSTNVSLNDIYNSTNFTIDQVGTYTCIVRAFDGLYTVTNSTTFDVINKLGNSTACGFVYDNITLTANISSYNPDICYHILTSNIVLNCNGFSLTGAGVGGATAIYNNQYDNVVVKNCIISNFTYGIIYTNGSTNGLITNSTISNTTMDGILIKSSSNSTTISFTRVNKTDAIVSSAAINISNSFYIQLINVTTNATSGNAISLYYSNYSNITNSTGISNFGSGIYLRDSSNNNILNSTGISSFSSAIWIHSSSNNTITNSMGIGTTFGYGINFRSSDNNNLINSIGISTSRRGIMLDFSSNNLITNSTAISTSGEGIFIHVFSKNNIIVNSFIYSQSNFHIYSASGSDNNTFINTTFNRSNVGWGSGSSISVMWTKDVKVIYSNGTTVGAGVSVNVINNTGGAAQYSLITDASGYVRMLNLTEYHANGVYVYNTSNQQNYTTFNNHVFSASIPEYYGTNSTPVNDTQEIIIVINTTEEPPGVPVVYLLSPPPYLPYNETYNFQNFTFTVTDPDDDNPINASLWANFSGTWEFIALNQSYVSLSPILTGIMWNISQGNGTYIWNIEVCDGTFCAFAPENQTIDFRWHILILEIQTKSKIIARGTFLRGLHFLHHRQTIRRITR